MVLVNMWVINTSNICKVAEKTSKQNTINSQEASFLSHFLCCKLAHAWRCMCVFYLDFLLRVSMIRLKLILCVILLYLYQELDVSEALLSPATPLKVGAGHSFWWWGWLTCPVPSSTSHALPSTHWEGVWEGVQAACCSLGGVPRGSQEMSSPPSLMLCHSHLPVALGLGGKTWTNKGRGLCSEHEALARIWLSSAE